MGQPSRPREWQDIAREAANEQNPLKRAELTEELSTAMDERRKYFQNQEEEEKRD